MESTPSERYNVIRKITIAIVIQAAYVFFMFHYVPIPESIKYVMKAANTCCVPITTLQNDGYCEPKTGKWNDMCVPLVMMNDASVIYKHCVPSTGHQKHTKINLYTEPSQDQSGENNMAEKYCEILQSHALMAILDRCVYTLRWQLLSAATLLFAIIDVAWRRLYTKALDPINGQAEHLVQVKVRILQNTTEQLICNLIGQLVLCTYLTETSMKIIPILVSLFVFGRIIFKFGYEQCPSRRTYGFAFTYIPTVVTYLYCAWYEPTSFRVYFEEWTLMACCRRLLCIVSCCCTVPVSVFLHITDVIIPFWIKDESGARGVHYIHQLGINGAGALGSQVLSLVFEVTTILSCLLMLCSGLFDGVNPEECFKDGKMFVIIFYGLTGCMDLGTCFLMLSAYHVSSLDASYYIPRDKYSILQGISILQVFSVYTKCVTATCSRPLFYFGPCTTWVNWKNLRKLKGTDDYFCAFIYWVCCTPSDKKYRERLQPILSENRTKVFQEDVVLFKRRRIVLQH